MKRTTLFLLGALIASAMPLGGLRAQSVNVNVDIRSLDRAALTSATLYAGNAGQLYIVDSTHLMLPWSGTALLADSALASTPMTIAYADGSISASATVDSATYGYAFIVVRDTNDRCYVLGTSSRQSLDTGYFAPAPLMSQAVDGVFSRTMTVSGTMLGTERPLVFDGQMYAYTSFTDAIALCPDSAVLNFMDTIRVNAPIAIAKPLTIYQMGYPIVSSVADASTPLISLNATELSWFGNATGSDIVVPAGSGDIFDVNASKFTLRQFGTTSYARPVVAHDGSLVTIAGSSLHSLASANNAAVTLMDSANASISSLNVTSPVFAEYVGEATGMMTILDSTAAATPATIGADAFFRSGNYRKYLRTLGLAAAAANDTVFLARNTAGGTDDTIVNGAIIDLQGNVIQGRLFVDTEDTVVLQNGDVNYLAGVAGSTGTVVINDLDSIASLNPNDLSVVINNARVLVMNPVAGANVTVLGGKYGQDVSAYLPARYTIVPNMDADSVPFRYTVGEGYRVTFVNYNARQGQLGYADSVAIVNTVDNRIVPAPSRPTYVGADTIFSAYFVNPEFTTPWNFLNDVLTSDTVLYAKWYEYNALTDARITVYHYRQALDGTYPATLVDSAFGVAPLGQDLYTPSNTYVGFTSDKFVDTILNLSQDTTINFHYVRNHYDLTFVLNGGTVEAGVDTVVSVLYGDNVTYPTVSRPGYTLTGWNPSLVTMPAFNCLTHAIYERNTYPLTWSHVDTTVTYNGTSYLSEIAATYVDDNANVVPALLTVTDVNGNLVTEARNAGVYTITATPADTNYQLGGVLVNTLTILPAPVVATGISVVTAKLYDGTTTATVNNMGTPSPVYGNDDLGLLTTATYDNPTVGDNHTITAQLTLVGMDLANYTLASPTQVITTSGVIVAPLVFDNTQGTSGNGIAVSAAGYCSGDNAAIQYYLTSGNPDQYQLIFDNDARAQGFTNVIWNNITTAGNVDLVIPADAMYGTYNATLTLRNSAYPQFESAAIPVSFLVNLSRNYTRPIFSDVIGVVDTCNCIDLSTVKWYHNGTYVADGPYYQEVGGLTGTYHVTMTMNGNSVQTCEQDDLVTTAPEAATLEVSVSAYPNPAVDQVSVTIENSYSASHSLRVMNVMGVTLFSTTFEGESTTVDFSRFGAGSYTVSVDGVAARVIKY